MNKEYSSSHYEMIIIRRLPMYVRNRISYNVMYENYEFTECFRVNFQKFSNLNV